MARVFLDTNIYIELTERAKETWEILEGELIFISSLSTHILFYVRKLKVPNEDINLLQNKLGIVPLTKFTLDKALQGPTKDLEDNIQLHSAAEADCDIFLTLDKDLLNIKYFGKTQIISPSDLK